MSISGTKRGYSLRKHRQPNVKFADYLQPQKGDDWSQVHKEEHQPSKRRRQTNTTNPPAEMSSAPSIVSDQLHTRTASITTQCSLSSSDTQPTSQASAATSTHTQGEASAAHDSGINAAHHIPQSTSSAAVSRAGRSCSNCGTDKSASNTWRRGPAGEGTLCNKCGLSYKRQGAAALNTWNTATPQQVTSSVTAGSGSSTAVMAFSSQPSAAAPQSCEVIGISRSSSCLSAVIESNKPRNKVLRQIKLQQQAQELRRSSRQQLKRSRQTEETKPAAAIGLDSEASAELQCKRLKTNGGPQVQQKSTTHTRSKARPAAAVAVVVAASPVDEDLFEAADVLLQLASGFWMDNTAYKTGAMDLVC